jgi:hypothetical protein
MPPDVVVLYAYMPSMRVPGLPVQHSQHAPPTPGTHGLRLWELCALASIGLITLVLVLVAWRVSGHEAVRLGTVADRIYVTDGFHDPEHNPLHGFYRWTEPLAQITLPNWGPGRLNVSISGVGAGETQSEARLTIAGRPVDHVRTLPGQPWTVRAWGISASRNPTVTLESPRFQAPNDPRPLGQLVTHMEIYAPDARLRAWLHLGLLALTGGLLYRALALWTARPGLALVAGAAVPAVYGLLVVYRDLWMETVVWVAPPLIALILLADGKHHLLRGLAHRMSGRGSAVLAVVALSAALLLLALGYLNAFDSERMYQVAAGLAEYGLPTRYPGRETWTKYGFGQSLVAVPFYLLGKLGVAIGGEYDSLTRFTVSLTNLPLTAVTCWLLYRAGRRFASAGVALMVVATYLITTPALNYARTFFSEPGGALLLLAATLLLVPRREELVPSNGRILLAGVCLGAMVLFKPAFAVHWIAPGLALLWMGVKASASAPDQTTARSVPVTKRLQVRWVEPVRAVSLLYAGPMVAGLIQLGYNYLRYRPLPDAIFRTGYEREPGFSTPLLEGLWGLLFSPGKSIFLYAPVALLAPVGLWVLYRHGGWAGKVAAGLIGAQVAASFIFNAMWWAWTGNFAWGPRLVMTVLPLLVWPLAPLGERVRYALAAGRRSSLFPAAIWLVLAVFGALVSIPGAMVDFQVYFRMHGLLLAGDPGEEATLYDPAQSPLVEEPAYLLNGLTAAIHRPSLSDAGLAPVWDRIVPAILVAVAVLSVWLATRSQHTDGRDGDSLTRRIT